jgi:hypothetical protein
VKKDQRQDVLALEEREYALTPALSQRERELATGIQCGASMPLSRL